MAHDHVFRWRYDRPPSSEQFNQMFPDDWSCAAYRLRRKHINNYLNEFVFRFNRRRHYRSSFDWLLDIGFEVGAGNYWDITGKQPVFQKLKEFVRGKAEEDREWAYTKARLADVDTRYARRLLDPAYPS